MATDFCRVTVDTDCGILDHLSCSDIVLPAVPGTGNDFAFEWTLTKRASAMQAGVIDGVKLSGNVCEGHGLALDLEFPHGAGSDFVHFDGSNKSHDGRLVCKEYLAPYLVC